MRRIYRQEGRKTCRILHNAFVSDWIPESYLESKAPEEYPRL